MAVALTSVVNGTPVSSTTLTVSVTPSGSNRYMLIDVGINEFSTSGVTVSSVVFNGSENATLIARQEANNGEMTLERWGLVAPSTGAHNVVVTISSSEEFNAVCSMFTGVDQVTPLGTSVIDTYASGSTAHSHNTTGVANGLIWDAFVIRGDASSLTPDAGQTTELAVNTIGSNGSGLVGIVTSKTGSGTVSTGYTWGTATFGRWVHVTSPIKPVSAAVGNPALYYRQMRQQ